jgi:quinol monooxygenase YgiN
MTPPLPWRASTTIDPAATYVITITRLPLARHRRIPKVMGQTIRIVRALARADGLVGYSLKADILRKTFWTVSAWENEEALHAFVRSDVHRAAMASVGPYMKEPRIETLRVAGGVLPLPWADIRGLATPNSEVFGSHRPTIPHPAVVHAGRSDCYAARSKRRGHGLARTRLVRRRGPRPAGRAG